MERPRSCEGSKAWHPHGASYRKLAKYSVKNNTPPFEQWKPWRGDLVPGHFYVADIEDVRRALLEQGISPRICMKDRHEVRQLTIGKCCIHTVPEDLASIQNFRKNLSQRGVRLDYYGEGLPAISNKALTVLLRHSRARRNGGWKRHHQTVSHMVLLECNKHRVSSLRRRQFRALR